MPSLARNAPLFIAFRVLFNARFYYPIFGILFLDLGLTLEQFALLNVVWALVIVTLEVPSGALADWLGRRTMIITAAFLMVAEMLLLAFAPSNQPDLLFLVLLINRILSGAAEASASGADEALAFDSLPESDRETAWPALLSRLMRWKSGAFFLAMLSGALLYDANFLHAVFGWTGWHPLPGSTVRWPVYACLITSLLCLIVAFEFREPPRPAGSSSRAPGQTRTHAIFAAWTNILQGARQVLTVRRIFFLILAALLCDSFVRIFLTLASNYYRLIELPPVLNGLLGSTLALLGFLAAPLARRMVAHFSVQKNFLIVAGLVLLGLVGVALATPWWGVWVVLPLGLAMSGLQFFASHYLNLWTTSDIRATVLSFRGVAFNLGYGAAGLAFAALTNHLRLQNPSASENSLLALGLPWLPPTFFLLCLLLLGWILFSRPLKTGARS